jgi:hypothetical protein
LLEVLHRSISGDLPGTDDEWVGHLDLTAMALELARRPILAAFERGTGVLDHPPRNRVKSKTEPLITLSTSLVAV